MGVLMGMDGAEFVAEKGHGLRRLLAGIQPTLAQSEWSNYTATALVN